MSSLPQPKTRCIPAQGNFNPKMKMLPDAISLPPRAKMAVALHGRVRTHSLLSTLTASMTLLRVESLVTVPESPKKSSTSSITFLGTKGSNNLHFLLNLQPDCNRIRQIFSNKLLSSNGRSNSKRQCFSNSSNKQSKLQELKVNRSCSSSNYNNSSNKWRWLSKSCNNNCLKCITRLICTRICSVHNRNCQ